MPKPKRKFNIEFWEKDESMYDLGLVLNIFGEYRSFGIEVLGVRLFHITYNPPKSC